MEINVNGEVLHLAEGGSGLVNLLELLGIGNHNDGIAVAINMEVVPKSEWSQTQLKAGDDVEVITARQGG